MKPFKVLIVDDSSTMRRLIRSILSADERLDVVAEAATAGEARDAVNQFRPDVMTLDVEMPNMSGIEFLKRLMRHRPMPVVMVSTLTKRGSDIAVEALSLGAIECVEKPQLGNGSREFENLANKVVLAAQARLCAPRTDKLNDHAEEHTRHFERICLLGGSTGAVDAIERILIRFPRACPPTLITQHMPEPFLASFAARLDPLVKPKVSLAQDSERLEMGRVYIAPGGAYHLNITGRANPVTKLVGGPQVSGHRPSVDSMFSSALPIAGRVVAGILTGMGRDGAAGLRDLRQAGAKTLGQSKESCVVFGMPKVAGELGGVEKWSDLDAFGEDMLALAEKKAEVRV